ncbi:MAG: hypothetical protein ACYC2T_13555, partial [Bacillota bacterium]
WFSLLVYIHIHHPGNSLHAPTAIPPRGNFIFKPISFLSLKKGSLNLVIVSKTSPTAVAGLRYRYLAS